MASGHGQSMERYYAAAITQSQLLAVIKSALTISPSPQENNNSAGNVVVGLAALSERAGVYSNSGPLLNLLYREIETATLGGAELSDQKGGSGSSTAAGAGLKRSLAGADMTFSASKEILYNGIKEKISSILMAPIEDIKPDARLEDLGLDELRNWLVRELGISISVIDIADSASVSDLSERVAARMG
jgi:acyl carrier protein